MSGAADDSEILVNVNSSIMEDFVERARLMEESDMISGKECIINTRTKWEDLLLALRVSKTNGSFDV